MLPYINADPVLAKRLEDAGAATVMPLGSPIGSNRGLETRAQIEIIIEQATVPVIVDAGIGAPSHAAEAMEMGAAAVLVNTAIAIAADPGADGARFSQGGGGGPRGVRDRPGRAPRHGASATSPLTGLCEIAHSVSTACLAARSPKSQDLLPRPHRRAAPAHGRCEGGGRRLLHDRGRDRRWASSARAAAARAPSARRILKLVPATSGEHSLSGAGHPADERGRVPPPAARDADDFSGSLRLAESAAHHLQIVGEALEIHFPDDEPRAIGGSGWRNCCARSG